MPEYVYPTSVCVVRHGTGRVHLNPDQKWRTDDPFVKARPEFFAAEPIRTARSGDYEPPVEQATAAPGERRAPRRPARKTTE